MSHSVEFQHLQSLNPLFENISRSYRRGWKEPTRLAHLNTIIRGINFYVVNAKASILSEPNLSQAYADEWNKVRPILLKNLVRLGEVDEELDTNLLECLPLQLKGTIAEQSRIFTREELDQLLIPDPPPEPQAPDPIVLEIETLKQDLLVAFARRQERKTWMRMFIWI